MHSLFTGKRRQKNARDKKAPIKSTAAAVQVANYSPIFWSWIRAVKKFVPRKTRKTVGQKSKGRLRDGLFN